MKVKKNQSFNKTTRLLVLRLVLPFILLLGLSFFLVWKCFEAPKSFMSYEQISKNFGAINYDLSIPISQQDDKQVQYGYDVFLNTAKYLGPNAAEDKRYAGNSLACNNCHLWSGTKSYSAPLVGIVQRFPQYRGREDKTGTLVERINGCMERSMNGNMLPVESKEMKGLLAYLGWLSKYAPEDGKIKGTGFVKIKIPNRVVNLKNGKKVFETTCTVCHGKEGKGIKSSYGFGYEYPPLWGNDSYNNGAGMTRVLTAARFIKGNMPYGTTYENPFLTDEEAYDVAGYINQQLRPSKKKKELDFPNLKKKPVSTPYPPYADTFSIKQHQIGPFQPIMEYYKTEYNLIKTK